LIVCLEQLTIGLCALLLLSLGIELQMRRQDDGNKLKRRSVVKNRYGDVMNS
jgi:hypothetical protein